MSAPPTMFEVFALAAAVIVGLYFLAAVLAGAADDWVAWRRRRRWRRAVEEKRGR